MISHHWFILVALFVANACNSSNRKLPDVDGLEVSVTVERWDQDLFGLEGKEQIAEFLKEHPLFSKQLLHIDQYPHDSVAVNYLHAFLNNPGSSVLQEEISQVFGDLDHLQEELERAFKYLRYYYPNAKIPQVYTAVTGFAGNDLFVSDSTVIIGLDYYLGDGATFRPLEFPQYILKRYRTEYIVPSIILLLSSGLNKTELEDHSMLAEMIYFGKAYYFARQILPFTADSLLIGYSGKDLSDVKEHQEVIWAHFIEKQLLYENNHLIKKKYMDERPKTLEIGNDCPGRIGAWVGWEIVKKYMAVQQITLPELMETSDAQQLFMQSRYKPQPL
ncbi:MAG: gliding motility lipoprotein GldB [Bacteroidetes bacterium]|nr:MAG: gliding motility lipoprotein GldB [Bacteroidota bacterium]